MKLAIADPPYPPYVGDGGQKNRATIWYGDRHPEAAEWNDPARHRQLLLELIDRFHGFAIATPPDGLAAYGQLPAACRLLAWVNTNAAPGAHRIHSRWEAVILYPPAGRRSSVGVGVVPNVLVAPAPRAGFPGAKPGAWTRWVLDAMSYDQETDEVVDLFPGSGAVSAEIAQGVLA